MNRRAYLTAGAGLLSGFAGCGSTAEGGTPAQEEADSVTLTPVASPTKTPGTWPTEPIETEFSGTGSDTITGVEIELTGPTLFHLLHRGSGDFSADVYNKRGDHVTTVVDGTGTSGGENAFNIPADEYDIEIEAGGDWALTVSQKPVYPLENVITSFPLTLDGSSDEVDGPIDLSESRSLSVSASGVGENIVIIRDVYGAPAAVVLNETGTTSVDTRVEAIGVAWIDVTMSGKWELTIE